MGFGRDEAVIKEKIQAQKLAEADYCPADLSNYAYSQMKDYKAGSQQDCLQKLPSVYLVDNDVPEKWKRAQATATEHNKELFGIVDQNNDGRLSLKELTVALSDPDSDLSKFDRNKLISAGKTEMSRYASLGYSGYSPSLSGVVAITLPEFLKSNREVY